MKKAIRLSIIAFLLASILAVSMYLYHPLTAKACGAYIVTGSNLNANTGFNSGTAFFMKTVHLSLGYNSCTGDNFTQVTTNTDGYSSNVAVTSIAFMTERSDNTEVGFIDCGSHASSCTNAYIYSPTLKAKACVEYGGDLLCTDWF
jgi:hypothetical protein